MTPEERCRLISKHFDRTLSEQEESLLVRLLNTDADMARWFCDVALQHARLGRLLRGRPGPSPRQAGSSFWARLGHWALGLVACVAALFRRTRRAAPKPGRSRRRAPSRLAYRLRGTPTMLSAPFPWRPGRALHSEQGKTAPTRH